MLAVLLLNQMATKRRKLCKSAQRVVKTHTESLACCRTCLKTEDLISIFHSKEVRHRRTENLRLVTGLEIKMNDGLPQKICTSCLKIVNLSLEFRKTSRAAQRALLGVTDKKSKVKKEASDILKSSTRKVKVKVEMTNDYMIDDAVANDFQTKRQYSEEEAEKTQPALKKLTKLETSKRKYVKLPNAASYKCNVCNKEFSMKGSYRGHMRYHTHSSVCESCGKRCRNNNQLQEHKRARHGLDKIHTCSYCEYSSATKDALINHLRRHTGERPYVCDHCGSTFHRRANLVQHIGVHVPDKKFQCKICLKMEKTHRRLQVHISQRHREKKYRYLCPMCPKTYSVSDHVRRHLIKGHALPRDCQGPIAKIPVHNQS